MRLRTARTLDRSRTLIPCKAPPPTFWASVLVTVPKYRLVFNTGLPPWSSTTRLKLDLLKTVFHPLKIKQLLIADRREVVTRRQFSPKIRKSPRSGSARQKSITHQSTIVWPYWGLLILVSPVSMSAFIGSTHLWVGRILGYYPDALKLWL